MAKKKDNKNLITGIIAAVAAVALIAVIVVVVIMSNKKLDESYFVSDDTKYVLALDAYSGMVSLDTNEYEPEKVYMIYFYSGDEVTDLKVYYEYEDDATAKEAADYFNELNNEEEETQVEAVEANGNYVVITMAKELYEDMTADDAKEQVEFMEMIQNMDFNDYEDEDVVVDEDVEVVE